MEPVYIYPGTFCPATYGHARIAKRLGDMFPEVFIVCSENPDKKNRLFTPAEAKALWCSYDLPKNVLVDTLEEFLTRKFNPKRLAMIVASGMKKISITKRKSSSTTRILSASTNTFSSRAKRSITIFPRRSLAKKPLRAICSVFPVLSRPW